MCLAIGQAIFQNNLIAKLKAIDSSISATQIIAAGATGLQKVVPQDELSAILIGYAESLSSTFHVAIAMGGLAFIMTCFVEWKSLKGK